jgi:hypothetical protein
MPASATQMTLEEAQAALVLAQQEVISASAEVQSASNQVSISSAIKDSAEASYSDAVAAWEATKVTVSGTSTTTTQNVVQNGTFDSTANWSNVMASSTVYTGGSSPIIYNNTLKGSYTAGVYIQQTGTFPSPTRQVTFAVDVWNYDTNEGNRINNPDYYRIEFRTYDAAGNRLNYYNIEWSQWHDYWITRGGTYTLSADAVRWDIGFRLQDSGYWAGAFGPVMDNVRLFATMTTSTPDTYTYGEAETAAKDSAYQVLQTAQADLDRDAAALATAQNRLTAAIAEVARLEALIIELTPHLNAPTNLTAVINGANVDLSWTAPEANLSGVTVERYAIMWSTTNFESNGWGWVHDQTNISIPLDILNQYGGLGNVFQFAIRADNDTQAIYSPRSNIASVQTTEPEWWMISFNENETVTIGSPAGYVFAIPRAWYGTPDGMCGIDVSLTVSGIITGNSTASFVANNDLFTDPCPGWGKVLRLSTPITPVIQTTPTPEPTTESSQSEPAPQPTQSPEPSSTPTPTPSPTETAQPQPQPQPEPSPQPIPEPSQTPVPVEPVPIETPEPQPSEEPSPEPTLEPTPEQTEPEHEITNEPTPEPSPEEPEPAPTVDQEPTPTQTPEPTPSEEPETIVPEEEPVKVEIEEEISAENIENLVEELAEVVPQELTEQQQELIVEAAMEVFASAEQGSPEYEAALDALLVVAQADDVVLDEALAAVPLIGNVAGAAVEVFNAIGNAGSDMSPQVREQSEKVVIGAIIVGQVAMTATAAATSAAAAAARRP